MALLYIIPCNLLTYALRPNITECRTEIGWVVSIRRITRERSDRELEALMAFPDY
jgi:hypothetical protein